MPEIPPSLLARFGRGVRAGWSAVRPAVPFAVKAGAFTGAVVLGGAALGSTTSKVASSLSNAFEPPLQKEGLDTDPTKPGNETWLAFDRRTGRTLVFGQPASDKVGPERSQEREIELLLLVAGAAVVLVLVLKGRGK